MQTGHGGEYKIDWRVESEGVDLACTVTGSSWVGIGWLVNTRGNAGFEAMVASYRKEDFSLDQYRLAPKSLTGIEMGWQHSEIRDVEIEMKDDMLTLKFQRLYNEDFEGVGESCFVVGYHSNRHKSSFLGVALVEVTIDFYQRLGSLSKSIVH